MDQNALSNWLKLILAGMGLCGLVVYAAVLPWLGLVIAQQNPEMSHRFWPWLIFLWATGLLSKRLRKNIISTKSACKILSGVV